MTSADALRGPPSSNEISPKKSPGRRRLEDDLVAGVVADEELDLALAHDVERVAGIAEVEEVFALREPRRVDAVREHRALVLVEQREEWNLTEDLRLSAHQFARRRFSRPS